MYILNPCLTELKSLEKWDGFRIKDFLSAT
jgi:hypothetical protein